ncbi:hypothetical protein BT96DRAFT_1072525, partial [Gymnopus androsaceus JB14]
SHCKPTPAFKPRIDVNKLGSEFGSSILKPQIEEVLLSLEGELADFESEIVRLQSQIDYVKAQKEYLLRYQRLLRSFIAPIRPIPNELLGIIFEFTCEVNVFQEYPWLDQDEPPPTDSDSELSSSIGLLPALAISAVCARWRLLALLSPRMWSKLSLELSFSDAMSTMSDGLTSTLELYLERSANSPLCINLAAIGKPMKKQNYLVSLTRHSHHWRSFKYR